MCGIAGAFAFSQDTPPIERSVIEALNNYQRSRGPDGDGLWSSDDRRIVLGHRRLAIIDIGDVGAQPMTDASGRWLITFNGEIYNYKELRLELEHLGCRFVTNSDTEVLINAVAQWGEAGLLKLRGMYAFALWDKFQQELWLVRDPYGIKPLYYATGNGIIWFASQARALASCAPVDTRRDAAALAGFYLLGHVPEPFSWWAGVQMLPAGSVLRIGAGRAPGASKAYVRVQDTYISEPPQPLRDGELHDLLSDSVKHHLVSDVPLGIFLSAGTDSNVIAALVTELGAKLKTVTLAFEEFAGTPSDEAPHAEAMAKALGIEHQTVRISASQFFNLLDDFLNSMDQPTIDGLNTYLISGAVAGQGLKVALSGLGGDELFGGYPSFKNIPALLKTARYIPTSRIVGKIIATGLQSVRPFTRLPKLFGLVSHSRDVANAYLLRRALYLEDELEMLIDQSWLNEGLQKLSIIANLMDTVVSLKNKNIPLHAQIAALESCWYMRNQLLRDTDWSSMAHGLEVRVPFVDMRLIQRLGSAIASDAPPNKHNLARCVSHILPIAGDHAKTGFVTPVRSWISQNTSVLDHGLRGWAKNVHRCFRTVPERRSGTLASASAR